MGRETLRTPLPYQIQQPQCLSALRRTMSARDASEREFVVGVDCERCASLLTPEFVADGILVADKRGLLLQEVLSFALWWYHDHNHPSGAWHPTGVVDMPVVHEI